MITRTELSKYLNALLNVKEIKDYCPNGLQIEGKDEIKKIITGVTACQALIDKAIEENADAILVHHGYFWKGEAYPITGMKKRRIGALIKNDINLLAYHLPLDVHPELGNNAQLAKKLGLINLQEFETGTNPNYGMIGEFQIPISLAQFKNNIEKTLNRTPLIIEGPFSTLGKVALCTGGAQDFIEHAYEAGADTYISGEISERTTHLARELGINYIAAGHHATERYGVQALGDHLKEKFDIECQFIDIDNPA